MTDAMTITYDPTAKQGQRITSYAVEFIGDQPRLDGEPERLFNVMREFSVPNGFNDYMDITFLTFPVGTTVSERTCREAGIRMPPPVNKEV